MIIVYRYHSEYLNQSVSEWVLKAYQKGLKVDILCEDINNWDEILWRRGFIPHGTIDHKYQKVLICTKPRSNTLTMRICETHIVEDARILFIPNDSPTIIGNPVYSQSVTGKWSLN